MFFIIFTPIVALIFRKVFKGCQNSNMNVEYEFVYINMFRFGFIKIEVKGWSNFSFPLILGILLERFMYHNANFIFLFNVEFRLQSFSDIQLLIFQLLP